MAAGSLEEAPPSELADGTSPTELTDSALRNWFDSAYEVAMQASAAEPQSPDAAAGAHAAALLLQPAWHRACEPALDWHGYLT